MRCAGSNRTGDRCNRTAAVGSDFCAQHVGQSPCPSCLGHMDGFGDLWYCTVCGDEWDAISLAGSPGFPATPMDELEREARVYLEAVDMQLEDGLFDPAAMYHTMRTRL